MSGKRDGFEGFVRAQTADLARLAPLSSAAEDLVQATLLRAWRSWVRVEALPSTGPSTSAGSW